MINYIIVFVYLLTAAVSYAYSVKPGASFDVRLAIYSLCWPVIAIRLYFAHISTKGRIND